MSNVENFKIVEEFFLRIRPLENNPGLRSAKKAALEIFYGAVQFYNNNAGASSRAGGIEDYSATLKRNDTERSFVMRFINFEMELRLFDNKVGLFFTCTNSNYVGVKDDFEAGIVDKYILSDWKLIYKHLQQLVDHGQRALADSLEIVDLQRGIFARPNGLLVTSVGGSYDVNNGKESIGSPSIHEVKHCVLVTSAAKGISKEFVPWIVSSRYGVPFHEFTRSAVTQHPVEEFEKDGVTCYRIFTPSLSGEYKILSKLDDGRIENLLSLDTGIIVKFENYGIIHSTIESYLAIADSGKIVKKLN